MTFLRTEDPLANVHGETNIDLFLESETTTAQMERERHERGLVLREPFPYGLGKGDLLRALVPVSLEIPFVEQKTRA